MITAFDSQQLMTIGEERVNRRVKRFRRFVGRVRKISQIETEVVGHIEIQQVEEVGLLIGQVI